MNRRVATGAIVWVVALGIALAHLVVAPAPSHGPGRRAAVATAGPTHAATARSSGAERESGGNSRSHRLGPMLAAPIFVVAAGPPASLAPPFAAPLAPAAALPPAPARARDPPRC